MPRNGRGKKNDQKEQEVEYTTDHAFWTGRNDDVMWRARKAAVGGGEVSTGAKHSRYRSQRFIQGLIIDPALLPNANESRASTKRRTLQKKGGPTLYHGDDIQEPTCRMKRDWSFSIFVCSITMTRTKLS